MSSRRVREELLLILILNEEELSMVALVAIEYSLELVPMAKETKKGMTMAEEGEVTVRLDIDLIILVLMEEVLLRIVVRSSEK